MLNWLFGKKMPTYSMLAHSRGFTQEIVGEAQFQKEIERIVGPKEEKSANYECIATLVCESDNKHDANAVAVYIGKRQVGYLAREDAPVFRSELLRIEDTLEPVNAKAKIVGGWKNDSSEGSFGVKLNVKRPLGLLKEKSKK